MQHRAPRGLALVTAVAILAGCAAVPATRYYLLASIPGSGVAPSPGPPTAAPALEVGPVSVPPHLDRPNIVTRVGPNQLELAPFDSWAEPLDDNIARVLAEDLGLLAPAYRVTRSGLGPGPRADYRITVEVHRFDGDASGHVVLAGFWRLLGPGGRELVAQHRFELRTDIHPDEEGFARLVAAQSELLAELSRELAGALTEAGIGRR